MSLLDAALEYAEAGFPVFPLVEGGKNPATKHGVKDATKDIEQIKKWWRNNPNFNIGLAMGERSGLIGLDIDYKDGCDPKFLEKIPKTVIVQSPSGGHHAYFKYENGVIKNNLKLEKGVTIRSDGYYFAAPPSVFKENLTSKEYVFVGRGLKDGEVFEVCDWFREIGQKELEGKKPFVMPEQVLDGEGRERTLVSLAGVLRNKGFDYAEILTGLETANSRCVPPKPQEDLERIARSYSKYPKGTAINDTDSDSKEGTEEEDESDEEKQSEIKKCGGLHRYFVKKELEKIVKNKNADKFDKKVALEFLKRIFYTSKTPIELAKNFILNNGLVMANGTPLLKYYRNEFYRYKGNSYQKLDDEWLMDRINRYLINEDWKELAGTEYATKIFNVLKIKPYYVGSQIDLPALNISEDWMGDWQYSKNLIPLKSRLFDAKDEKEIERSPRYFFNYELPFDYDKEAKCPIFDSICSDIFSSPEDILIWEEIMGVHIYNPFLIEKMFILYGQGANGKSLLTTILRCLLGEKNVSSVPIDCFNANNFTFHDTLGKLANIIPDMKDVNSIDEGAIKAFISREEMHFNRKNKPSVRAKPTAFLTACTNVLPKFSDKSDGQWRRILLLEFKKQIKQEDQRPEYRDPDFWNKSGELAGIFNKALAGAKRVQRRGHILETESSKNAVEEYRQDLNHMSEFTRECLEFGDYRTPSHPFFRAYDALVTQNKGKVCGAKTFFHQLSVESKRMGHEINMTRKNERKDNYTGKFILGAKLNEYGEGLSVSFKRREDD